MPSRRGCLAGLLALTTGCTGGGGSTPTRTSTPTFGAETRKPEERIYPTIVTTAVVSKWEEYGDVYDEQTNEIEVGAYFAIGSRFETLVHDSSVTVRLQVEVYRGDELVTRESATADTLTDESGVVEWEMVVPLRAAEWEPGDYSAEVILQDETTGETSSTKTVEFTVVEGEETPETATTTEE